MPFCQTVHTYPITEYKGAIDLHVKHGDWHLRVNKDNAHVTRPVFQSLDAFWPGTLTLLGHLDEAIQHLSAYHEIWKQYGFIPETYNLVKRSAISEQSSYLLRPGGFCFIVNPLHTSIS
ncbi:alpha-1 2-Mannosidase [Fasciolopsis buskii]|uniref:Alpha-1 2-Mannosidase n=1 Tax=Fasciolopsis buskii TaxID=27845 RepID=A0A8E0RPC3_9TREM|nr:alpha-1 2-Mannosidase [Fasciolopsis buski]